MSKTQAPRLNLSDAVDDLAPEHPPCFHDRRSWLEFLKSAAAVQNQRDEQTVIAIVAGQPTFNIFYNYCADCLAPRAKAMEKANRCYPSYLLEGVK